MLLALTNVIYEINLIHDARIHVYKISTLSSWGCLPRLPKQHSSQSFYKIWICMLGLIYSSCMIRCFTTLSCCNSGVLEQNVSRTMDRTRWANSMACSLPWFKSLRFLPLGKSDAYCSCYRSQWCPGLGTTNTEWIGDGPYDTWNFPASQEIAVQQCKFPRGRSRWTLRFFRRPMFV